MCLSHFSFDGFLSIFEFGKIEIFYPKLVGTFRICTWVVIIYTEVFRRALLRLERGMHFRFASKWESVRSATAKEHQSIPPFIHLAEIHPMGKKFDDWENTEKELRRRSRALESIFLKSLHDFQSIFANFVELDCIASCNRQYIEQQKFQIQNFSWQKLSSTDRKRWAHGVWK